MRFPRALAVGVPVLLLAACREPSPAAPELSLQSQSSQQKLTGGGWFDLQGVIPVNFNYDVSATLGAAASGTFHIFFEADGAVVDFDGAAQCLSVDSENHRGWVGGVITANRSTHPAFTDPVLHAAGADVWFRVVDYGEGAGAPADRSTTFGFRGSAGIITSAEYCATRPWPDADARTWPVVRGNIQVR